MSSQFSSKRRWIALCLGVLVSGAALWPAATGRAKGTPLQWRVGAPISYKNLTLFPVHAADAGATDAYITLDEGIRNGTVVITERGAREVTRRVLGGAQNQRVTMRASAEGDSVNQLALINRSGKKLLLLGGEVVVGGKQDRIVEEDLIVPPVSVPVSLNVFCVEHGRWSQRTASYSSGGGGSHAQVAQPTQRSVPPYVAQHPAPQQNAPENFSSLGAISHPKLRAAAQDKKQQTEVWKEVSDNNSRLGTSNNTDTYQEVYANAQVNASMDEYIAALEKQMASRPGVVGVIVARNGELVWVDCFASASLFRAYWPKLLKSYVVDAMGEQGSETRPTIVQAHNYLTNFTGRTEVTGRAGIYRLVKIEQPGYAIFQLEDISLPQPFRLHFNKMQRN